MNGCSILSVTSKILKNRLPGCGPRHPGGSGPYGRAIGLRKTSGLTSGPAIGSSRNPNTGTDRRETPLLTWRAGNGRDSHGHHTRRPRRGIGPPWDGGSDRRLGGLLLVFGADGGTIGPGVESAPVGDRGREPGRSGNTGGGGP